MLNQAVATLAAEPVAGGPGTFADRIQENQSMVFSIAYHSLRDYSLAEELAQDVFLELHKRFETFQSRSHVRNWLRKVAANRCIDQSRRRKLRPQLGLDDVLEPASPPPTGDPLLGALLGRLRASRNACWPAPSRPALSAYPPGESGGVGGRSSGRGRLG